MTSLMVYVNRGDDCWTWERGHDGRGYSIVRVDGKCKKVHRIFYELYCGPIAEGMEIHHKCGNKGCVRPAHLQAVTRSQHMRITCAEKGKVEACRYGHPYDEANTYMWRGQRCCRACNMRYTWLRRTGSGEAPVTYPQTCWKCGHEWNSRVTDPKQCANASCKVRQHAKGAA